MVQQGKDLWHKQNLSGLSDIFGDLLCQIVVGRRGVETLTNEAGEVTRYLIYAH